MKPLPVIADGVFVTNPAEPNAASFHLAENASRGRIARLTVGEGGAFAEGDDGTVYEIVNVDLDETHLVASKGFIEVVEYDQTGDNVRDRYNQAKVVAQNAVAEARPADADVNALITGTIRARRGHDCLVITRSGERLWLKLEGLDTPKIGVDIAGVIDTSQPGAPRMRLVDNVTNILLKGRARIVPFGRAEITARMIAKILQGIGPGTIVPGTGGMIERTPGTLDADVAWALDIVAQEIEDKGVGLNIIDPIALAASPWNDVNLQEEVLPADMAGDAGALTDLKRLLNDGLSPTCRKTIESIGRGISISSVDFILPYSPFATGISWSCKIAGARKDEIVLLSVSAEKSRRISTFREIAKAFSSRYLGNIRCDAGYENQVEDAFADVAAALALKYFDTGGGDSAFQFQRLREAALSRWDGYGDPPPATGFALGVALGLKSPPNSADDIFKLAASIAKSHAPANADRLEKARASSQANGVFFSLEDAPTAFRHGALHLFQNELSETISRLNGSDQALERLSRFGVFTVPMTLEDAFNDMMPLIDQELVVQEGIEFANDPWASGPMM